MDKKARAITVTSVLLVTLLMTLAQLGQAVEWSTDTRLTWDVGWDMAPSIIQTTDGRVWIAWHSERTGNNEIFYKTYDGLSWSSDIQLTTNVGRDLNPCIMQANDGRIWVVWDSYRNELDEEIYYKIFDGVSWSDDTRLTTNLAPDKNPSVTQTADGRIWVVWSSIRTGDPEIFYKVFDGSSWSGDTRLTTDQVFDDEDPCVMQANDGRIWVVWSKKSKAKNGDIYFMTFDGSTWSDETQLTSDTYDDLNPAMMQAANDRIWVTWNSDRKANNMNVYYKIFDGSSWTSDIQLTTAMEDDKTPSVTQITDGSIWVVWASKRILAQFDIYYRMGMELHDVAVLSVTPYASHNTTAFRGETVYIEVGVQNDGEARERVEVHCYANSILIQSRIVTIASGQYYSMVFTWDTSQFSLGFYTISAKALAVLGETDLTDNSLANGSVELRIKGDIVGVYDGVVQPIPDGCVDIDDFVIPIIHFGCAGPDWPHPTWDPVADVTEDLLVDIDDIMTVGVHYGEI